MAANIVRVEVTPKLGNGMRDVRGELLKRRLASDHNLEISSIRTIVGFLVKSEIDSELQKAFDGGIDVVLKIVK